MSGAAPGTGAVTTRRAGRGLVLDERSRPDAKAVLGCLLSRAEVADLAVGRIRLAAIDFRERDLATLRKCRVVIGRLDVHALLDAIDTAAHVPALATNVGVLRAFIATGRLELRSAGARRWSPDFCIVSGPRLGPWFDAGAAALVGHVGLGSAGTTAGPRLTSIMAGRDSLAAVASSFERLWATGHDVLDVVADTLARLPMRS